MDILQYFSNDYSLLKHNLYILRWIVLAIPGAWVLIQTKKFIKNTYLAMVISQALLGAVVFFVDKFIFSM